jgi:hypothetical protein
VAVYSPVTWAGSSPPFPHHNLSHSRDSSLVSEGHVPPTSLRPCLDFKVKIFTKNLSALAFWALGDFLNLGLVKRDIG